MARLILHGPAFFRNKDFYKILMVNTQLPVQKLGVSPYGSTPPDSRAAYSIRRRYCSSGASDSFNAFRIMSSIILSSSGRVFIRLFSCS